MSRSTHPYTKQGGMKLETVRISINETGEQGNGISSEAAVSADGRWVAFSSSSFNLTDDDQSPVEDVFVHERETGAITILSTVAKGQSQDGDSRAPRITADGSLVAWESVATNLVPGDTNDLTDIFIRSRMGGAIVRLSVNGAGAEGNGASTHPDISADGTLVAFESDADNLVLSDTNGVKDIFVVETSPPLPPLSVAERGGRGGEVIRISVASDGTEANGDSSEARLSADGRYVVFTSEATNLVVNDTNGVADVFLHDRVTGVTERVSIGFGEEQGDDASGGGVVSPDGRSIVFESRATNFSGEDSAYQDIFLRDRDSESTLLLSATIHGGANQESYAPDFAAGGRYVVYASLADNLVQGDTNGRSDIFRKDSQWGTVVRLSVSSDGVQGSDASNLPSISATGGVVAFESEATNLVPVDTNGLPDVFTVAITEPPEPTPPQTLFLPLILRDTP